MPDFTSKAFDLSPGYGADSAPIGHRFGDVLGDNVQPLYSRANKSVVSVTFVAGNPRNDVRLDGTFLTVEQKQLGGSWKVIRTDDDYDTKFHWKYTVKLLGLSKATMEWYLSKDVPRKSCMETYTIGALLIFLNLSRYLSHQIFWRPQGIFNRVKKEKVAYNRQSGLTYSLKEHCCTSGILKGIYSRLGLIL